MKNIVFTSYETSLTSNFFEITINFKDSTIGGNLSKETRSFVSRCYPTDNRAENDKGFSEAIQYWLHSLSTLIRIKVSVFSTLLPFFSPSRFFESTLAACEMHVNHPSVFFLLLLGCEKKLSKTYLIFHCVVGAVSTPFVVENYENEGKETESYTFSDDCIFRKLKSTCPGWWTFFIHPAENHRHAPIKSAVINIPISGGLWCELLVDMVLNQFTWH